MADRKVWVKHDEDESEVWVGLDLPKKTLCLVLSESEASELLSMLRDWEADRG